MHIEQEPEMKISIHKFPSSSASTKAQTAVQSPRNSNFIRKSSNLPVHILNSPSAESIHNTEVTYILPDSNYEDSFYMDDYEYNNNNTNTNSQYDKEILSGYNQIVCSNKSTIYEREMRNLFRKEEILKSKRIQAYQNEISKLQEVPCINSNSNKYYKKKRNSSMVNLSYKDNNAIPIYQRACDLHSQRIHKIKINEEIKTKNKQEYEESIISSTKRTKRKYNKHTWNRFVESQFNWKEQLTYKNKINQLLKEYNINTYNNNSKIKSQKY